MICLGGGDLLELEGMVRSCTSCHRFEVGVYRDCDELVDDLIHQCQSELHSPML